MKEYFCSIIVPVYNAEKIVGETINSILNQTYKNFELLLIDDCSTDNSYEVLQEYAKKDNRIVVCKNEKNMCVAKTRNRGVELAKYDWIALCDADDIWYENKLEEQFKAIDNNPEIEFCATGLSYISNEGTEYKTVFIPQEKVNFKKLLRQNIAVPSTVLIKKELMQAFPMDSDKYHEDFICWLRMLKSRLPYIYTVQQPLMKYRLTANSRSRNKFKCIIKDYKSYRAVGLNMFSSLYYTFINGINGLKKYSKIK